MPSHFIQQTSSLQGKFPFKELLTQGQTEITGYCLHRWLSTPVFWLIFACKMSCPWEESTFRSHIPPHFGVKQNVGLRVPTAPGPVSTPLLTELLELCSGGQSPVPRSHFHTPLKRKGCISRAPPPPSWSCDKGRCHVPVLQQVKCAVCSEANYQEGAVLAGLMGVKMKIKAAVLFTELELFSTCPSAHMIISSRIQFLSALSLFALWMFELPDAEWTASQCWRWCSFLVVWTLSCVMLQWRFCPGAAVCELWEYTIHETLYGAHKHLSPFIKSYFLKCSFLLS